jgi:PPOX class probable F420-dependent enzyme
MQMTAVECAARLQNARFAVLGTSDERRGAHLVPVVFVTDGSKNIVPVDSVKPKTTTRLRRIANLKRDPSAALLIDHREDDWERLWWVRADLTFDAHDDPTPAESHDLATKYPRYASIGAISSVLRFDIDAYRGWTASPTGTTT